MALNHGLSNYLVLTGGGVHLYYIFDEPIAVYPHANTLLKELKFKLTDKMWNMCILQGFRVIGGCTKLDSKVRAYKMRASHVTLEYMHSFLSSEDKKHIKLEDINYVYKT